MLEALFFLGYIGLVDANLGMFSTRKLEVPVLTEPTWA